MLLNLTEINTKVCILWNTVARRAGMVVHALGVFDICYGITASLKGRDDVPCHCPPGQAEMAFSD